MLRLSLAVLATLSLSALAASPAHACRIAVRPATVIMEPEVITAGPAVAPITPAAVARPTVMFPHRVAFLPGIRLAPRPLHVKLLPVR